MKMNEKKVKKESKQGGQKEPLNVCNLIGNKKGGDERNVTKSMYNRTRSNGGAYGAKGSRRRARKSGRGGRGGKRRGKTLKRGPFFE